MTVMIRFHLDEHVPTAVALGLRRRGIDVTTPADADTRRDVALGTTKMVQYA